MPERGRRGGIFMQYTIWELTFFFFIYAFLGWCLEVAVLSIRRRKFFNPGVLSGPFCPSYGVAIDLILIFLAPLQGNYILQAIGCMVIANAVEAISSRLADKTAGRRLWNAEKRAALGSLPGFCYTLVWGGAAMLSVCFFNPLIYILCQLMPRALLLTIDIALAVLFLFDLTTTIIALHPDRKESKLSGQVTGSLRRTSGAIGKGLSGRIHRRLENAFPPALDVDGSAAEKRVFAKGLNLSKLFWVFLICSLLGDWIETIFVWATSGVLMSRSSVLYGTFSIVWGLGAVLLTVVLLPLAKKGDRYVFLGGFLLGGTYEYACSVFTEIVFGQVFWDYSWMPLNIGGRTNVLYMFFWGLLAVVWIQILYPRISALIEKIPVLPGEILTWCLAVLMVINALLSGLAIARYSQRQSGEARPTAIGNFLDNQYPDELVEWVWPNMKGTG